MTQSRLKRWQGHKPERKRALGVVLYEMVTGKWLYDAQTVSHSLAATLREDPNLTQISEEHATGAGAVPRKNTRRIGCGTSEILWRGWKSNHRQPLPSGDGPVRRHGSRGWCSGH